MELLNFILFVMVALIGLYMVYLGYLWAIRRYSAKMIKQEELEAIGRKGQWVDVREAAEFDARHILGARNIPISQFKARFSEIRKDQPVYLIDEAYAAASRAAFRLKRNGYTDIYVLKDGMTGWTGKIRSNNKK